MTSDETERAREISTLIAENMALGAEAMFNDPGDRPNPRGPMFKLLIGSIAEAMAERETYLIRLIQETDEQLTLKEEKIDPHRKIEKVPYSDDSPTLANDVARILSTDRGRKMIADAGLELPVDPAIDGVRASDEGAMNLGATGILLTDQDDPADNGVYVRPSVDTPRIDRTLFMYVPLETEDPKANDSIAWDLVDAPNHGFRSVDHLVSVVFVERQNEKTSPMEISGPPLRFVHGDQVQWVDLGDSETIEKLEGDGWKEENYR